MPTRTFHGQCNQSVNLPYLWIICYYTFSFTVVYPFVSCFLKVLSCKVQFDIAVAFCTCTFCSWIASSSVLFSVIFNPKHLWYSVPVSYTHLDVYKRQDKWVHVLSRCSIYLFFGLLRVMKKTQRFR